MTLFEVLTGRAFDHQNWQHSEEFEQNFSKKSNAPGFARGWDGRFWNWPVHYTDRITSPLIIGEIFVPSLYRENYLGADHRRDSGFFFLYRQNYLAADHRRDFGLFIIQTELPRRWSSTRFWFLLYIQTELPRRWSSARFSCLIYTDRITSPLIIGEFLVCSLYRQNYLAADHWRDFRSVYKKKINCYIYRKHLHEITSLYIFKHSHNMWICVFPRVVPRLHLARSGSQSHRAIWFILPARGASHIINHITSQSLPVRLTSKWYLMLQIVTLFYTQFVRVTVTINHPSFSWNGHFLWWSFYTVGPDAWRREDFDENINKEQEVGEERAGSYSRTLRRLVVKRLKNENSPLDQWQNWR